MCESKEREVALLTPDTVLKSVFCCDSRVLALKVEEKVHNVIGEQRSAGAKGLIEYL